MDDTADLRSLLRGQGDVVLSVGRLQSVLNEMRVEQRSSSERTEKRLTSMDNHLGRQNARLETLEQRLHMVEKYQSEDKRRRELDDAFAKGRATAFITWGQWKIIAGFTGGIATLASGIAAGIYAIIQAAGP